MKKNRKNAAGMEAVPEMFRKVVLQTSLALGSCLRDFTIDCGLQVFAELLASDVEEICGPRYRHDADRKAYRHSSEEVSITFGGRKIKVAKPRVRSLQGEELQLATWQALAGNDALGKRALAQILAGVTTRRYEDSLEAMPDRFEVSSTSKSAVSRRFVAATTARMKTFLNRPIDEDYRVIMLDGLHAGDHVVITAMGITWDGRKRILGCHEGSTENAAACRRLLSNLVERGLEVEVMRLFVIDGAKAVRSAVKSIFGRFALIQRCQFHKETNVLDHLPDERKVWTKTRFRAAVRHRDVAKGKRLLRKLAADLETDHPSAAASIREGFEELFTVGGLGADGWLFDTLRTTNPLENAHKTVRKVSRNVKRWRSGSMVLRWAVTGFLEAEARFRRIKGYQDLPKLVAELDKLNSPAAEQVA